MCRDTEPRRRGVNEQVHIMMNLELSMYTIMLLRLIIKAEHLTPTEVR